jgi:hypothetical protein
MIPQMQSRVGQLNGRCFEACIASLLEIPEHAVPDFPRDDADFREAVQQWLSTWGLFYIEVPPDDPFVMAAFDSGFCWHLILGVSPRGGPHACVGLNGVLTHDPHPGANPAGLVTVEKFGFLVRRM